MKREPKILKGVKVIDLFCGLGGFHLALKSFGADIIWASEWDIPVATIYEKNFGLKPAGDITKIDAADIPDHDILCAGFPCQAFSISGNMNGFDDNRGTLFFDIARIIKEKKPKLVFLENVKNLQSHDNGKTFVVIKNTLSSLGYSVFYKVLDSSKYGSAQKRERIYILAFRNDANVSDFIFPAGYDDEIYVEDIIDYNANIEKYIIDRQDVVFNKNTEKYCKRPLRIGIIGKGGQGERIYSIKGKAITLSAYGGGVGSKTGIYRIDGKNRKLTPRECARLQTFPDEYIIDERDAMAYKQFGNSLVINVVQTIIEEIIRDKDVLKWLKK